MTFATSPRRALAVLIVGTLLIRVGWAFLLGVNNDEAYNFLYTVHPSLSYFDHPPLTMWVAKAGLLISGGNVSLLSLRLGYLLLFAGSTWVLFKLTSRWYGEWAGFHAAVALNLSAYFTAAAGALALPDGPFLFFTLLTIWALTEAVAGNPGSVRPWLWVGLAWAGALLTKYHAVLLPAGAFLYLLISPRQRRQLGTPGPYLAVAIGLTAFIPVVIWNAEHGWASFAFQGSRAVGWHFLPVGPLLAILGCAVLLSPWIGVSVARAVVLRLRGPALTDADRLLLCLGGLPLAFFLVISCGREILPHWPLMGFLPLFCFVGQRWAALAEIRPVRMRRFLSCMAGVAVIVALAILAQARLGLVTFPSRDLCWGFSGWNSVGDELRARGLVDQPNTFLFTGSWDDSGQLAFSVKNRLPVLCYSPGDARGFAFWSQPADWVGKDGYLISLDGNVYEQQHFQEYFERIEPVASFPMTRGGKPYRSVRVFRCSHQVKPFPFTYTAAPVASH
jgi:4-amino-4-deoxy-L-arabinose transferase-like glycosyltransferase